MPANKHAENKLLQNLPALTNMIRRIAIEAGDITMKYFEGGADMGVQEKGDGSPVSLADQEAETYIEAQLLKIMPDIPMVGEESKAAGNMPDLTGEDYFWLVDPLDGTREFINGSEDFTVNIALIHGTESVLGVVYLPATGVLYAGCKGGQAIKWNDETKQDKLIQVRRPPAQGLTIVSSRNHSNEPALQKFLEDFKVKKISRHGSSLKMCVIAEGKADLYPRLGPTCEWDTAAAHAVLSAAGGVITELDGQHLTYGHTDRDLLNPNFCAASVNWFDDDAE